MRFSSRITSSSARIDFSRPTKSGTIMWGKTTMSRSGRTGSVSGPAEEAGREGVEVIFVPFAGWATREVRTYRYASRRSQWLWPAKAIYVFGSLSQRNFREKPVIHFFAFRSRQTHQLFKLRTLGAEIRAKTTA